MSKYKTRLRAAIRNYNNQVRRYNDQVRRINHQRRQHRYWFSCSCGFASYMAHRPSRCPNCGTTNIR